MKSGHLRTGTLLLFLCCAASLHAATYFIDDQSGLDGNNGLSKQASWKRHPYMKGFAGSYSHRSGRPVYF